MNYKVSKLTKRISIIIPVRNEASSIVDFLKSLQYYRSIGHEIILVDGGSTDETITLAKHYIDYSLCSKPGRACQMNQAANIANNQILLFLHSDTYLPKPADTIIIDALAAGKFWGRFDITLSGRHFMFRIIEKLINLRSRYTKIATGDQAIFIDKTAFNEVNGYPDIALMEDIALSKKLRKKYPCACLTQKVITSSRRWEQQGIFRTIILMWCLRFSFFIGVNPKTLYNIYYEKN